MSYSRLGENKVESWGRRASFKRYIYVEELQNDGQLGRAVTCQNLLSLFFFSFLFFLFSPSRHQSTQFLNQAHGTGCMKLLYNCISLCRLPVQILEGDVWGVEEFREAFFFFFFFFWASVRQEIYTCIFDFCKYFSFSFKTLLLLQKQA